MLLAVKVKVALPPSVFDIAAITLISPAEVPPDPVVIVTLVPAFKLALIRDALITELIVEV